MDFESPSQLLQSGSHRGNSNTKRYRLRARSRLADWHTAAIVANPKLKMRIRSFDGDRHPCRFRMTENIRKGFLNDPHHRALPLLGQFIDFVSNLETGLQSSAR